MSDTELNDVLDLVSVIALTTQPHRRLRTFTYTHKKREDLKVDSDAMIEQLRNVFKVGIGEKLASVGKDEMSKIEYGVKLMLGL